MTSANISTPAEALKAAAVKALGYGCGPATVQQELHAQGILVSIEDCRDAIKAAKAGSVCFFHST